MRSTCSPGITPVDNINCIHLIPFLLYFLLLYCILWYSKWIRLNSKMESRRFFWVRDVGGCFRIRCITVISLKDKISDCTRCIWLISIFSLKLYYIWKLWCSVFSLIWLSLIIGKFLPFKYCLNTVWSESGTLDHTEENEHVTDSHVSTCTIVQNCLPLPSQIRWVEN